MKTSERRLKETVRKIVALLEKAYGVPHRATTREDPLDLLVGTILSQNTSDVNSHRAYQNLVMRFPTWHKVLAARLSSIERAIRCGGLAPTKARRIKSALAWVKKEHGELSLSHLRAMSVGDAIQHLGHLPGVGLKTVTVVMLFGCDADICPVDTHVHRLAKRIGLVAPTATRDATFEALQGLIPRGKGRSLHVNLINHGRTVCKAQRPRCRECVLRTHCDTGRCVPRGRADVSRSIA